MKKTIIAAAVAASVAAPAAFADVTISGMVNPEFFSNAAGTPDTEGYTNSVNSDLVFTVSEDLGNGMKASAKYHVYGDNGAPSASGYADATVTLSGDFGSVTTGRMEPFIEAKADAFLSIDPSHNLDVEDDRRDIGRANGAVAYVSPNFNGLTIGLAAVTDASALGDGAGTETGNANTDDFDVTDIYVSYSMGGLTVFADQAKQNGATGADETTITAYGAGYKMGDLEVRAMQRTTENAVNNGAPVDADLQSTGFAAKYTMGANTISVAHNKFEDDDATVADYKETIYGLSHAMSKRTSVYVARQNTDQANNDDVTVIGVKHTF
jgi:predicted porin